MVQSIRELQVQHTIDSKLVDGGKTTGAQVLPELSDEGRLRGCGFAGEGGEVHAETGVDDKEVLGVGQGKF